ncbi:MAG: iron-sulfur cluster assembly protein [Alphaproteobacteria bacterium]|nr:iron-sulfur cluster assembly protein [Alphaproteobacteria bacterium]
MDRRTREHHLAEVWERLGEVTDPELDEPVTELGFVERVDVDAAGVVEVDFRLPTYWCAANFAFLMVDDIRIAVEGADWVKGVKPKLQDHMYADEVNRGVGDALSFKDAFGKLASDGTLDDVRKKFRIKAFQRRQEMVLRALRRQGFDDASLVEMDLGTLEALSIEDEEGTRQKPRYLRILREFGCAPEPGAPAFVTPDGDRITAAAFQKHMEELRGVRINMEFNGAICRGLLSTRYKEAKLDGEEPTLVDFIHGNVPARARARSPADAE